MNPPGHYGAALLVYAPLGTAVAVAGHGELAVAGGALALGLTRVPDWDLRIPGLSHRGPTHTVQFACLVGAIVAALTAQLTGGGGGALDWRVPFVFAVGTCSILAHVAADTLTPAGVRPFWPVSDRHYSLRVTRADNRLANYTLLVMGVGAVAAGLATVTGGG